MHSTLLRSPCPRLCGVIFRVNSTNVQTFSRASLEIILNNLSHPSYSHTHFLHSLSPCLRLCLLNSPLPPPSPYLLPPLPLPSRKLWTFPYPHFPCFRVKQPTHPRSVRRSLPTEFIKSMIGRLSPLIRTPLAQAVSAQVGWSEHLL